jgi:hypothetical protein
MRYTRKGESSSKFVKKEDLPAVRKQLKQPTNCERMKLRLARWIDLATQWSSLRLTKETGRPAARTWRCPDHCSDLITKRYKRYI